jgi:hypothetical protein
MPKGRSVGVWFGLGIGALALLVVGVGAVFDPVRPKPAGSETSEKVAPGESQANAGRPARAEAAATPQQEARSGAVAGEAARSSQGGGSSPSQVTFTQPGAARHELAGIGVGAAQSVEALHPAQALPPTTPVSALTRDPKLATILQASGESCRAMCERGNECRVSMPGCGGGCERQLEALASVQASNVRIQSCLAAQVDLDQCTAKLGCDAFEGWVTSGAAGPCTSRTYARNAACPGILLPP